MYPNVWKELVIVLKFYEARKFNNVLNICKYFLADVHSAG